MKFILAGLPAVYAIDASIARMTIIMLFVARCWCFLFSRLGPRRAVRIVVPRCSNLCIKKISSLIQSIVFLNMRNSLEAVIIVQAVIGTIKAICQS